MNINRAWGKMQVKEIIKIASSVALLALGIWLEV